MQLSIGEGCIYCQSLSRKYKSVHMQKCHVHRVQQLKPGDVISLNSSSVTPNSDFSDVLCEQQSVSVTNFLRHAVPVSRMHTKQEAASWRKINSNKITNLITSASVISLSSTNSQENAENEEVKQAVGGVPADSQQNAVFYSDADLLPCAAEQNLPKFAGIIKNITATDTNRQKLSNIPVTDN